MTQFSSPEPRDTWLSPSEALNRFQPPEGSVIGANSPAVAQRTRFGFRVGDLQLLIKLDALSEVLMQASIYPLPNVPLWFPGVLNLRGNLLPVFDLHRRLETGDATRERRAILVLDQGSDGVGMPIDGLPQSIGLGNPLQNLPPLHSALEKYVTAAYASDNGIWLDFDHQGFFTELGQQVAT